MSSVPLRARVRELGLFMGFSVILETTFVRYVLACTSPVAVRLQYVRLRHGLRSRQRGGDRYHLYRSTPRLMPEHSGTERFA